MKTLIIFFLLVQCVLFYTPQQHIKTSGYNYNEFHTTENYAAKEISYKKGSPQQYSVLNTQKEVLLNNSAQTNLIPCNNWLRTIAPGDAVKIGDLDVSGNQITVEAMFNRVAPYTGGYLYGGDLVSKHDQPNDCNYLLRPNNAEITTTNGFFQTPPICEIELNKTYHVAMTYNGSFLRFYRNGFLMKEIPASGDLILNNWVTTIGDYAPNTAGTPENMNGYINEVRIWNIARSQSDIQAYMNNSLPSPASQTGLLAYYSFNNLLNKQGNTTWNGTLIGNASINTNNTSCTFTADSCDVKVCAIGNDFSLLRNPCIPLSIQLEASPLPYDSIFWDLGDGNREKNTNPVSHSYISDGAYNVSMIRYYQGCTDTVKKTINISLINDPQTILSNDTTICYGTTKQLFAFPADSYCWTPSNSLNNSTIQNPISSALTNTTYYLTTESNGINLVTNGNFNAGNTGFTSQYSYTSNNTKDGEYFVGTNPQAWYLSHSACADHTTGNGNMLMVNGASAIDLEVWKTTVPVTPNTNYTFSTWIASISNPSPAQLSFSINGSSLGNIIGASPPSCTWKQFYVTWNSGNATTAVISIINKNAAAFGNDFALDDINFSQVFIKRDSVLIKIDSPSITVTKDTAICSGSAIQLNAAGLVTYSWQPATYLSNANSANPLATPASTISYTVTGTSNFGCTATDSVTITVYPKPTISISNDTLICAGSSIQLTASGGTAFRWSPSASLTDISVSNPTASPDTTTTYYVNVTDANNCNNSDSVTIAVRTFNNFDITPPLALCEKDSVQLLATGGDIYSWTPAFNLNNNFTANPIASPKNTTVYNVTITDTICNNSKNLSTTVTVLSLPSLSISKSNDIDCSNGYSRLNVTGAQQYTWLPNTTLNNPAISNPIASPRETTTYFVAGKATNGCISTDSITIFTNNTNKGGYLMPNAFTPNNDGINDCYGISNWGIILDLEFSIYNRWGELVFYTRDPLKCWDGTHKGVKQDPAVYTYIIRARTICETNIFRKGVLTLIK